MDIKSIPSIRGLNLLRNAAPLIRRPLPRLQELVQKKGKIIEFNGGKHQQLFFISDAEAVRHILKTNKKNFKRSPVIKALKPLLGDGIFISEGETWKAQHSEMKPSFHEAQIRSYEAVVREELQDLIDSWSTHKMAFVIEKDIECMMLRIMVRSLLVCDLELDYTEIVRHQNDVLEKTSIQTQKIQAFQQSFRKRAGLPPRRKKELTSATRLAQIATKILEHGRSHPEKCCFLLASMLNQNRSDASIRDAILNLIFAGYDTTASALSWTLFALANHPEEQEKVLTEVGENSISVRDITAHPYTKQVVQEAMRLYPPVWSIHRQSVEETSFCGYQFPANGYFMICSYTLHRDPEYWEHPNLFYPDHFLPENMKGKAFQYIPFGQGERICIGRPMAMMELQFMVPTLLQKFEFSTNQSKPDIKPGIIIKSRNGIRLSVQLRG
ncbi:MAG: cytochrome P450 [Bacteroidia bacterium]|nr:cytochrome P450 [Bacteroidia bacterium]